MTRILFYLLLSTLFISSCGDTMDMDDPTMTLATPVSGVDYKVILSQNLVGENSFQVFVENTEAVNCIETLDADWSTMANGLQLELVSTELVDCGHDTVFITREIDISSLEDTETFTVKVEEAENEASVEKTPTAFGIKFRTSDRLVIEESSILLIPENIAWGYANLTTAQTRDIAAEFNQMTGFPDAINFATEMTEGYYGYFSIGDLGSVTNINGEDNFGQSMILELQDEEAWAQLKNLLEGLKTNTPNLKYHFQNAEGEILEEL